MKVIAYDRFRPGVTMDTIQPYPPEEVANVRQAPLPLEGLMAPEVDVAEPYDRTAR